ncbi:unnamed protein product [marine sediment metagenome]|uniref:Uncharacterized protein n=1 Tax=marine sediment metagenome TaxID=412755 RepID=X1PJP8_9ZZZZ
MCLPNVFGGAETGIFEDKINKLLIIEVTVGTNHSVFSGFVRLEKHGIHVKAAEKLDKFLIGASIFEEMMEDIQCKHNIELHRALVIENTTIMDDKVFVFRTA